MILGTGTQIMGTRYWVLMTGPLLGTSFMGTGTQTMGTGTVPKNQVTVPVTGYFSSTRSNTSLSD